MSIGHRAISSAFGHHYTTTTRRTAAPTPASSEAVPAVDEAGVLQCSPWEGLYLEQARPVQAEREVVASRVLDSFLASLMYGE